MPGSLYLEKFAGIDEPLPQLKRNYILVALTYTNSIHEKMLRTKYAEQLMYFEEIFASHTMGLRKPEPNKYFMVLDDLKYQPHEVLFLDDNFLIMKAACNFGIDLIHLLSIEQMIYELKKKE